MSELVRRDKEKLEFAWLPDGRENTKTLEGMIDLRNEKASNEIIVSKGKKIHEMRLKR